jgi:hypothetical protein
MEPHHLRTIYAMLSSYCLAGCLMEHFAVFPGWILVSTADLPMVQRTQGYGSFAIYVIPKTILTLFLVYLWADSAKAMSAALSTASLRFSLAMLAISWASSFLVQIPVQLRIGRERDKNLVRRLVMTDWVRVLTMAAHGGAVIWAVAA